jgi:hypothetical protein
MHISLLSVFHPCFIRGSFLLLLLLLFSGCGSSLGSQVTGTVTIDGKPLAVGGVSFHPVGGGPVATARIQEDGSFELKTGKQHSLPPGEYRVTVMAVEVVPPKTKYHVPMPGKRLVPVRYGDLKQTDLHATIEPGSNEVALELTSG